MKLSSARDTIGLIDLGPSDDPMFDPQSGLDLVLFEAARNIVDRCQRVPGLTIERLGDIRPFLRSPEVMHIVAMASDEPIPSEAYTNTQAARARLRRFYADMFERTGVHALLAPTCAVTAPPLGEDDVVGVNGVEAPLFATIIRNVEAPTVTGVPTIATSTEG